jgi:hypothetical protein
MTQQVMKTSDFNLQKLSTKSLAQHIAASIQVESNIAIFGRRGTGKTEIAKQEIKLANCKEVYLNLSVLERVDMGGYPNILSNNPDRKFVDFLLPYFYESMMDGTQGVVALLDEVDKADPSLWAPLLEFTQFHSINGRKLPNLKSVIMTGNLISEGGARPSVPLLDRAEKYLVEADATSWLNWAGKVGGIHPSITSYLTDNPQDLFGAIDPDERYADPSPRGWAGASELLFKGEANKWNIDILNQKVYGRIGKEIGIKYSHYYEHYQQLLPLVAMIFQGNSVKSKFNKLEPTKRLVTSMIACARFAHQLDTDDPVLPKTTEYVGKFLQEIPSEVSLISIRSQIQMERLLKHKLDFHTSWQPVFAAINSCMDD